MEPQALDRSAIRKCCGRGHQHEGADAGNVLHHLSTLMVRFHAAGA
jgi:hypothetical protein